MEQGECQLFGDFYQDFEHQLALSGADEVYTAVGKTQKLKAALNGKLRRALIGRRLPDPGKYQEWVQEVREIAIEIESWADYRPRGTRSTTTRVGAPKSGTAYLSTPRNTGLDAEGDTRMSGTNALLANLQRLALEAGGTTG
ncbi:hypothetical protein K3495_g14530 [Podosphaera aphanis]|nr:hypothetical protein K3495_g14530 [Podosphaera aphanis]